MSHHPAASLRSALKQVAVTGATGSILLGGAVAGLSTGVPAVTAAPASTPAPVRAPAGTTAAAPVALRTAPIAAHTRRKVHVHTEMVTAARLKGLPYRYGANGPKAFDCSGYTQYVFKQQKWKLNRTAAGQYGQTKHIAKDKAKVGDLVFFYNSGGVYHVGIFAGRGQMWAAPHTGSVVHKQKIYGSNWKIGRVV